MERGIPRSFCRMTIHYTLHELIRTTPEVGDWFQHTHAVLKRAAQSKQSGVALTEEEELLVKENGFGPFLRYGVGFDTEVYETDEDTVALELGGTDPNINLLVGMVALFLERTNKDEQAITLTYADDDEDNMSGSYTLYIGTEGVRRWVLQ